MSKINKQHKLFKKYVKKLKRKSQRAKVEEEQLATLLAATLAEYESLRKQWKAAHRKKVKLKEDYQSAKKRYRLRYAPEKISDTFQDIPVATKCDDLTRLNGIGPVIASVLRQANLKTFHQLSECPTDELRLILRRAGISSRFNPDGWPAQAQLAAIGEWEMLTDMVSG